MDISSRLHDCAITRTRRSFNNPQIENGSYLSQEHREELISQSTLLSYGEYEAPEYIRGTGMLRRIGIVTEQGYGYAALVGEPENPHSELSIPIIGTTPWYTGIEGFNEDVVKRLTKDGNYVIILGAEGSYRTSHDIRATSPITLANSSAAVLSFSNRYVQELNQEGHTIDAHNRIATGASRGGNVSMGISALDDSFGQKVIATEAIAPRFPNKLSLKETPALLLQIGREALRLGALPVSLGAKRSLSYAQTLDLHPHSLKLQPEIGGAIMSGEAGHLLSNIDRTHPLRIMLLSEDGNHEHRVWEEKLWAHTNSRIDTEEGIHMHIPVKKVQSDIRNRFKAIARCRREGIPLTQENIRNVTDEIRRTQRPLGRRALKHVG